MLSFVIPGENFLHVGGSATCAYDKHLLSYTKKLNKALSISRLLLLEEQQIFTHAHKPNTFSYELCQGTAD